MFRITDVRAREILDSRANPTVEVDVIVDETTVGRAAVPAGASTGAAEAVELRDRADARYDGRGVRRAVRHVRNTIRPQVLGMDPTDQQALDAHLVDLDGTDSKQRLGANALLGVSLAAAHAAAAAHRITLFRHIQRLTQDAWRAAAPSQGADVAQADAPLRIPLPMTNMISGGLHAGGNLDFQDVLIAPRGANDYCTGLQWIVRVYRRLGRLLEDAGYDGRLVGDEGGYGPRLETNREAIEFVVRAIEAAGLRPGEDVTIALDVAASHFYREGLYCLESEGSVRLQSSEMIDRLEAIVDNLPVTSIEDGLAEEDWSGWRELTDRLGNRVQLIGDDLFATNTQRLRKGIDTKVANSVLIKVNQAGTLSEALQAIIAARAAGYSVVVSARSGETEDTTIADLAVGTSAEQIKIGSVARSERGAKYNQLLRIEEQLSSANDPG